MHFKATSIVPKDRTYACMGCGVEGNIRFDKRGRPFWRCHLCGITLFLPTEVAQAGFMVFQKLVSKMGLKFRQFIIGSVTQYQKKRVKNEKAPIEV